MGFSDIWNVMGLLLYHNTLVFFNSKVRNILKLIFPIQLSDTMLWEGSAIYCNVSHCGAGLIFEFCCPRY